ncbi:MAG: hypothetical protein AB1585_19935 [Thermodesulfobacteriota bacterium]
MDIQKIEGISPIAESQRFRKVYNFPEKKSETGLTPNPKLSEIPTEKRPNISRFAFKLQKTDQDLMDLGKAISSVQEEMISMRRSLPPFPPGSQERVRILKGYIGLRKLIEQLTIPREQNQEQFFTKIGLPELSDEASDPEVDDAIQGLDNAARTIAEERAALKME